MILFDVRYDSMFIEEAIHKLLQMILDKKNASVFFLNADCLYKAIKDEAYSDILNKAEVVLPDGIGLKLITKLFGGKMKQDCNGTDFSPILMEKISEKGYKVFFLGGKAGVAKKAAKNILERIPKIQIVGTNSGYFNNDAEIIDKINFSGADIIFVAMGVPLQEKWIARNREKLNPRLCLGVGALFDYLSGNIPRAPKFMRLMHLEWFWRIIIEPKRMFKRYIIDGTKLFLLVLRLKLFKRKGIS